MKKYIFLILMIISVFLTSCSNLFEKSEQKFATISGNIIFETLLPERTIIPTYPALSSTDVQITVELLYAENDGLGAEPLTLTAGAASYTITLPYWTSTPSSYKVRATAKKGSVEILSGISESFSIYYENQVVLKDIILYPVQTTGTKGGINLNVTVDSDTGITNASVSVPGKLSAEGTKSDITFTFLTSSDSTTANTYEATFAFKNNEDEILYSFTQLIYICSGVQTNTWVKNGDEPYLETTTTGGVTTTSCHITKELVDRYKLTDLYVKQGASNSGTGSFLSPLPSISKAIEKMNNKDTDYTIHIVGEVTGAQVIPDTLTKTTSGTYHAKSVTIIGATGLSGLGEPQDSLNGNFDSTNTGTTLTINTEVPVKIRNLRISGGFVNDTVGAGITINTDSEVWLEDGAWVTENKCNEGFAGIYNKGTLNLTKGKIFANEGNEDDESYAGGLQNDGVFIMTGGEISGNSAEYCGGISSSNTSTIRLYGGKISDNGSVCINLGAGGVLELAGDIQIDDSGYVFLRYSSSLSYAKIQINGALTGRSVATVLPEPYDTTLQYITVSSSPNPSTTLPEEVGKFAVKPDYNHPETAWFFTPEGTLESGVSISGVSGIPNAATYPELVLLTSDELATIANWVSESTSNPLKNITITLKRNIVLKEPFDTAIGTASGATSANGFCGTFDGSGYIISGLDTSGQTASYPGLFGCVYVTGTVKNLIVEGTSICGGIAGCSLGTIENCESRVTITGQSNPRKDIGGIAAFMRGGLIKNCKNSGDITNNSNYDTGGIVGNINSADSLIDSCVNTGNISGGNVGGIVGSSYGKVRNCINIGNVTSTTSSGKAGGITYSTHCMQSYYGGDENCVNFGTVTAQSKYTGGISAYTDTGSNPAYVANCYNAGTLISPVSKGGIIGEIKSGSGTCTTTHNFYKEGTASSGVFGKTDTESDSTALPANTSASTIAEYMNNWLTTNNEDNKYKTWTTKTIKLNGETVTVPVPNLDFEW